MNAKQCEAARKRRHAAYKLRCEGWTFSEIARNFGFSVERARQLVLRAAWELHYRERGKA